VSDQDLRIAAILGGKPDIHFRDAIEIFRAYIHPRMQFPCEAAASGPFCWEIPYLARDSDAEYERLQRSAPSHTDSFELLRFEEGFSTWMRYRDEDITVCARRTTDERDFWLGLAELQVLDRDSLNFQLVDDYVAFVRSRSPS
jgi:hypothetical protein